MDIEMIDEMQQLLDLACASPDTPEGRSALVQAAHLWRIYAAEVHRGIAFAATIPNSDREALAALLGPHFERLDALNSVTAAD
jgi:hypothetical protein